MSAAWLEKCKSPSLKEMYHNPSLKEMYLTGWAKFSRTVRKVWNG